MITGHHLFHSGGCFFAYFPAAGCTFRIGAWMHALLQGASSQTLEDSADELIGRAPQARRHILRALRTAKALSTSGLSVNSPNDSFLDEHNGRLIEYQLLTQTGNLQMELHKGGVMGEDIARKALEFLFAASPEVSSISVGFNLTGPVLNTQVFVYCLEYARSLANKHNKQIRFFATTDALLADERVAAVVRDNNVEFRLCLEDNPPLEKVLAGLKTLTDARPQSTIRCRIRQGQRNLEAINSGLQSLGIETVSWERSPCFESACTPFRRLILQSVVGGQRQKCPVWVPERYAVPPCHGQAGTMSGCSAGREALTVASDGCLYPCPRFVGRRTLSIGNVDEGVINDLVLDLWHKYHRAITPTCSGCWAKKACGSPCPAALARSDGTFEAPSGEQCVAFKTNLEKTARLCLVFEEYYKRRKKEQ